MLKKNVLIINVGIRDAFFSRFFNKLKKKFKRTTFITFLFIKYLLFFFKCEIVLLFTSWLYYVISESLHCKFLLTIGFKEHMKQHEYKKCFFPFVYCHLSYLSMTHKHITLQCSVCVSEGETTDRRQFKRFLFPMVWGTTRERQHCHNHAHLAHITQNS